MATLDPKRSWVCITFIGGGFLSQWDPNIIIYYNRKDNSLSHLMIEGDYVDGKHVEDIKFHNLYRNIRYV